MSSSLFDYIKGHIAIFDVVRDYVQLKPAGNYWKGPCPFHQETDASFTISPDKNIYYCFGCHASGDVVGFVAQKEQMSQLEAAQYLIEQYEINVPADLLERSSMTVTNERNALFTTNNFVASWCYNQRLLSADAQDYIHHRNLDHNLCTPFTIGYFPSGRGSIQLLIKEAQGKGILIKDLVNAGILMENKVGYSSPFEERIIFPIRDATHRITGFGGRRFRPGDERAKYYNSKETDVFLKGKILFGLSSAKKSIQERRHVFLVEGYTDCLAMFAAGYTNTVATLGTACTIDHLKSVARYAPAVYVIYDGDNAGKNAMLRLTSLCWDVNLELYIIELPAGEDPASYLGQHATIDPLIDHAQSIFSFFIKSQSASFSTQALSEKLATAEAIIELLGRITNPLKQNILVQEASRALNIPEKIIKEKISKSSGFTKRNNYDTIQDTSVEHRALRTSPAEGDHLDTESRRSGDSTTIIEEHLLALVINTMDHERGFMIDEPLLDYFSSPIRSIFMQIERLLKNQSINPAHRFNTLLKEVDPETRAFLIRVSVSVEQVSEELFRHLLAQFCKVHWKFIVRDIKIRMQQATAHHDTQAVHRLFELFSSLKQDIYNRGLI